MSKRSEKDHCPIYNWCTINHFLEGHANWHAGESLDLDNAEVDGGQYVAYLWLDDQDEAPVV